jgi:hypothetical protein
MRPRPFPSSRVHEALVHPSLPSLKLPDAINGVLNPSAALYSPFPGDLSPPLPLSIKAQPSPCPSRCPSSLLVLALSRVHAAPQPPRPDHLDGAPPAVKPLPTRCPARHRTVRIHLLFTGAPPVLARRCSPPCRRGPLRRPWSLAGAVVPVAVECPRRSLCSPSAFPRRSSIREARRSRSFPVRRTTSCSSTFIPSHEREPKVENNPKC